MDGNAQVDAWIAKLRAYGRDATTATAAEAAPLVERELKSTASAGVTPEGDTWAPTKSGKAPLQHAAAYVKCMATGAALRLVVTGHYVFHHRGVGKTTPRRPLLPDGDIPPGIAKAIQTGAERVFRRMVGQ